MKTNDGTPGAARALASRQNGARSRGSITAAGRARSARDALGHGLRARQLALPTGEDPAAFRAFAAAEPAAAVAALPPPAAPATKRTREIVGFQRLGVSRWPENAPNRPA